MNSPSADQSKRLALLDCMRALAVIMVILYHLGVETPVAPDAVAAWFFRHGLLGVDIFFPLSGFLITRYLLTRYSRDDIRVFFLRRFFRIVPLYMVSLAVYALACIVTRTNLDNLHNIWKNVLFLTGWAIFHGEREMMPYTITWSLSVEEFAYIAVGLGALLFRGRLAPLLVALTVGAVALRFAINLAHLPDVYFYPPARLDSVALGGLTAWAAMRGKPVIVPLLVLLAASWIAMQVGRVPFHTLVYFAITVMTCLVIHVITAYLPRINSRMISGVAAIGFYSYFIYLFHYFNIRALAVLQEKVGLYIEFWSLAALVLGMTYAQAWISYRLYEGPMMAWGRRLESRIWRRAPSTGAKLVD